MNTTEKTVDIHTWTPQAHAEPSVRIGVVLEEDGRGQIELTLADGPHTLKDGDTELATLNGHGAVLIKLTDAGLTVESDAGAFGPAERLRIEPREPSPLSPGAGITVRNIVAGRGFHWQKDVDQTLAGSLEFVKAPGGVVMVNELPLEHYLAGVITAEMSGGCPVEFLKAQCVVARSWLLAMTEPKHDSDPFDRCNDDCCQRYQGTDDMSPAAIEATQGTRGLVLMAPTADPRRTPDASGGRVLDANYSKSCGGISELAEHVWGEPKPGISAVIDAPNGDPVSAFMPVTEDNLDDFLEGDWLKSTRAYCSTHAVPVETIGKYLGRVDEVDDYFRWTVSYTRAQLESLLRDKLPQAAGLGELRDLCVVSRGVSGRASSVKVNWLDRSGVEASYEIESEYRIREVLHRGFLYSSAFAVRTERDTDGRIRSITLRGAGWGHGAGLCQIGALGMGLAGHDVQTICTHYYPDARLKTVYD